MIAASSGEISKTETLLQREARDSVLVHQLNTFLHFQIVTLPCFENERFQLKMTALVFIFHLLSERCHAAYEDRLNFIWGRGDGRAC